MKFYLQSKLFKLCLCVCVCECASQSGTHKILKISFYMFSIPSAPAFAGALEQVVWWRRRRQRELSARGHTFRRTWRMYINGSHRYVWQVKLAGLFVLLFFLFFFFVKNTVTLHACRSYSSPPRSHMGLLYLRDGSAKSIYQWVAGGWKKNHWST